MSEELVEGAHTSTRLLELLIRLQIHTMKGERNQTETILWLKDVGFTTAEIVAFTGVARETAAPIISKAKKTSTGKRGKKR